MGQAILYCFKCQKRILAADFAKGQAFEVANQATCSACVPELLKTLGPKDRETLLSRTAKPSQERQKSTGTSHAAIPERRPGSSQAATLPPRPPTPPGNPALPIGIAVAVVAAILIAVVAGRSGPEPGPVEKPAPRPAKAVDFPGAREAVQQAARFAKDHPDDLAGQVRVWEQAAGAAERSPHYEDARKALGAAILRRKEAVARDRAELDDRVRALLAQEKFQPAIDHAQSVRSRHDVPEWTPAVDQKIREIRATAEAIFRPAKEKARQGTVAELQAFRERVQAWGIVELIADLPTPEDRPWKSILGPGLECLRGRGGGGWSLDNGVLVKNPGKDDAAQTTATFDDAEVRIRFEIAPKSSNLWFGARQGGGQTSFEVRFNNVALQELGPGIHEILFVCQGPDVTATLDGKPAPVSKGNARAGCLQFNGHQDSHLRIHSIEVRPLK